MIGQSLLSQMLPASRDIRYGQNQNQGQMMGGGGDGRSANPGWDALSNAEKAAFYSNNPTMAGITQFGQKALNYAPFGIGMAMRAQQAMFPQFVADQQSVARGIDPGTGLQVGGYGSQPGTSGITPTGLYGDQFAGRQSTATGFFGGLAGRSEQAPAPVETREATPNPSMGSSVSLAGIAPTVAEMNQYDAQGNNYGGTSFGGPDTSNSFGEGQYAQGGMVRLKDLLGKAPGPDDGYGALQDGEFVIKKDAVKRYGVKMLEQINRRKIAKKQVSKFFKNHG
jgi:hypothetical protein